MPAIHNVKEIALEILSGKKNVKDYYITRHEEEYRDSNFQPSYYDVDRLSGGDTVTVEYYERPGTGYCDRFCVIDQVWVLAGLDSKGTSSWASD